MGLLKPIVDGRIRAITWKRGNGGLDKLGIIPSASGIQFVKRDDQGKLADVFVAYTKGLTARDPGKGAQAPYLRAAHQATGEPMRVWDHR